MLIIGCDYHPGFQQIAFMDSESGEWNERRLGHREEVEQFYRDLKVCGVKVCGDGGERARPLVRALARRTAV